MRLLIPFIAVAFGLLGQNCPSQDPETPASTAIRSELAYAKLSKMPWPERRAHREKVLTSLMAKFPKDVAPHLFWIEDASYYTPEKLPEIRSHYREVAKAHPDDPMALYLAAVALNQYETPDSIRFAEAARTKDPKLASASLLLAQIYSSGLRADKEKTVQNLRAFVSLCPSSSSSVALRILPKAQDPTLQANVTKAMRTRLASETEPYRLQTYATLWGLEFRGTPPSGHDALRKQVASDLKRLESINPHPDEDYLEMMLKGLKQTGASKETIAAFEGRILKDQPQSDLAYSITEEHWKKSNKEPEDQNDVEGWRAYRVKHLAKLVEWQSQFPSLTWLKRDWLYEYLQDDKVSEQQGVAAIEALLRDRAKERPDLNTATSYGSLLISRKWRPDLALSLFQEVRDALPALEQHQASFDNFTEKDREMRMQQWEYPRELTVTGFLSVALQLKKPELVATVRQDIEAPLAKDAKPRKVASYWLNRARLALLDQNKADALAYFQAGLIARGDEPPKMYHGVLSDFMLDEAKALWKEMGGTETAWARWSNPLEGRSPAAEQKPKEGRWEKPTKELPSFELSDLGGKTWRLKQMEGKIVMINLWATWCEPCQQELPHFQKLYEKVKDRADVQILSFNIDAELGLVAPFMKEKGFSFPVLLAYDFTRNLLDGIGIPQNWIVDGQGKWRWTQLGFGAEPDWQGEMLKRIELTRAESAK